MFKYVHHLHFPANTRGRDFVLGDLHGCLALLRTALAKVKFDTRSDRLFSVGDIIDRGPHSLECLQLLKEPWFFAVQGNHENMMLAGLKAGRGTDPWRGWMENGGEWFAQLSKPELAEMKPLLPLVAKLPITCTIALPFNKLVGISHAQPPILDWTDLGKTKKLTGDEIWRALWGRELVRKRMSQQVLGVDITFHGHTIVSQPRALGNMWFIDTGAYDTTQLTLFELNPALFTALA